MCVVFHSRGNKCQFCQMFVEALEEFPNHFIRSKTSLRCRRTEPRYSLSITSTPKAIARKNTSCCLATSRTKIVGSVTSRRSDRVIDWHVFPRLFSCFLLYVGLYEVSVSLRQVINILFFLYPLLCLLVLHSSGLLVSLCGN